MTEKKPRMSICAVEGAPPPATITLPSPTNISSANESQPEKKKNIFGKLFNKSTKEEKSSSIMGRGNNVNPVITDTGMSRKDTVTSMTESEGTF
uniref:PEST proteolytic signal-containing nuclear protein n=1 Tax=Strongyloides papillosus TaxID=174720 RepID=A0A0N5BDG2_STREA